MNGVCAGQELPQYVRDFWAGQLHEAGVEVIPYARLFGLDGETAYLLHTVSRSPIMVEGVDTAVLVSGRSSNTELAEELERQSIPYRMAGDALTARTAEEAICDGMVETRNLLLELDNAPERSRRAV